MNPLEQLADIAVSSIMMRRPMVPGINDLSLAQALDLQDLVADRLNAPWGGLAGFKIAWNTDAQLEELGLPHPGTGRVFAQHVRETGDSIALTDYNQLMIETEIVAYLGQELTQGEEYTAENVEQAIEHFTVGFEILDRLDGAGEATPAGIIGHNVFNAGAIVGAIKIPSEELDVSLITTRFRQDDEVVFEGLGKAPQDPFAAVAFLANHFTGRGGTLPAGALILCGSHIAPYRIEAPCELAVSMGNLGDVSFSVV